MDSSPGSKLVAVEPALPPTSNKSPPSVAGVKRPAASLLPAFEPLSSSPGLPRPLKRQARAGSIGSVAAYKYPTPVPTSSTGILSSSPTRGDTRPGLQRTQSAASERAPLSALPSVELNENGEELLLGRSSNSSNYQLSSNRLISRVHAKARYIASTNREVPGKVEIVCNGWNGLKVHCQGRTWDLAKGDTFSSETETAEIMLDVQDARVFIRWPTKKDAGESLANLSDSSWDDSPCSRMAATAGGGLQSSPLRRTNRIASPESPTPGAARPTFMADLDSLMPGRGAANHDASEHIEIYEDGSSDEQELPKMSAAEADSSFLTEVTRSFSSDLSDPVSDGEDLDNDPDEENDPIVHSFGPFGANLSNRMASLGGSFTATGSPKTRLAHAADRHSSTTGSPAGVSIASGALSNVLASIEETSSTTRGSSRTASPRPNGGDVLGPDVAEGRGNSHEKSKSGSNATNTPAQAPAPAPVSEAAALSVPSPSLEGLDVAAISNHVVNQLAYSRLSSTPLSAILSHLPSEERRGDVLNKTNLRFIIETIDCVGTIPRQGKDAAGKPLESEYYYIPEKDGDEFRRLAVTDGMRKPSLRNCRKQHKQYYWKRPRTP